MNNELFDRMMKDNLNKVKVAPSQGLKKSIGKKLFFQNILNFHKAKILVVTLLIGTASVFTYSYNSTDLSGAITSKKYQSSNEVIERFEKFENELKTNSESLITAGNDVGNTLKNQDILVSKIDNTESNAQSVNQTNASKTQNYIAENTQVKKVDNNDIKKEIVESDAIQHKYPTTKKSLTEESIYASQESNHTIELNEIENGLFIAAVRTVSLGSDYLHSPYSVLEKDISFKNKPMIRKEFSIGIYKSLMATNDVDNTLLNKKHQKFYWDFYSENEGLKTNSLGGIDVNYAIGTKTLKGKVSVGFNASEVIEQKPIYEFNEITDPYWLEVINVDELSWINTYGKDTCRQCFVTKNTEEFQDELQKANNVYKYIGVPFKLGAEVNFNYVKLDVMGGVQWNHLTNASGLYVKEKLKENKDLYFWDDLEVATINRDNDMLKRNYFSWTASANVHVRITRMFDLTAGYDMLFSNGNITKDDYILDKSMKYSQAKIGITFYPNRLPLAK